ncbi:putative RTA1 domain protein [Coniochaeta ligniaria NRRL 30616]|uniref:Putative RTA1 domain protein n=1 Tax=Coniochaeta ligniaria NRRL 30616 TaxID=1408157 RepID=A0A1J7IME9_9PEZI|nr:putative RTA1 domain protein [Coniochaeta ligniaria NRRL 30616]
MSDGQPVPGSLFVYAPNKVAPVIFTVMFAISAAGHIWQCYHYKCFKLIGLHPLCAVLFTAGYALREIGAFNYIYNPQTIIIYIMSQVFIFICPPLLELANYHVLGRILHYVQHLAPLPPSRVSSIFGGLLALVELLNSLGVSLSANPASKPTTQELGSQLTIAALSIQLGVIVIFVVIAGMFHWRCAKANIRARAVSTPLVTLYVSMVLILIRCIYRLIEHLGNTAVHLSDPESLKRLSPILRYEWFFYVFEATLMLLNSALWNVWNPGRYMPRNSRVYLALDGVTELEDADKPDKQPLLVTIGSVLTFGIVGAVHRKRQANRAHVAGGATDQGGADKSERQPVLVTVGSLFSFGILGAIYRRRRASPSLGELQDYPGSHRRLVSDPQ